jgi:hypothetical protein
MVEETQGMTSPPGGPPDDDQGKPPLATFRSSTDRTTVLEVNVWENEMVGQDGSRWIQYALTFRRSCKDPRDGRWRDSASYRNHDIPVLVYLLDKAQAFILAQRAQGSTVPC